MIRKLLIASAGAGKSERIAKEALRLSVDGRKVLLLTYTINNQLELVRHICRINKFQPINITVKGWFSFLLEDMVRPYQRAMIRERISGIILNESNPHLIKRNGGKPIYIKGRAEKKLNGEVNPLHYVTQEDNRAHTYYLAKLAANIHKKTDGMSVRRLAENYDAVFIDEVQDLVGWDFSLLDAIVSTDISEIICVGDFRQTIYQTSETQKSPQTNQEKVEAFGKMNFELENLSISWRCIQSICDFADLIHSKDDHHQVTKSQIETIPSDYAEHQGVFAVPASCIQDYIRIYNPIILRWNRNTKKELCEGRVAYNFGESKGLGFNRVLIIPTEKHEKFLSGETTIFDKEKTDDSRNKLYVAITRARYSVAFLHTGDVVISGTKVWNPDN